MAKREMVESHVDVLLKRLTGDDALRRDGDGDWPFALQRSAMYVRVQNETNPIVRVWSVAAVSIPESGDVFTGLNDLNKSMDFCRAIWNDGTLIFATELVGESLDIEELGTAMSRVASAADVIGPRFVSSHGGETLRDEEPPPEASTKPEGSGMYL